MKYPKMMCYKSMRYEGTMFDFGKDYSGIMLRIYKFNFFLSYREFYNKYVNDIMFDINEMIGWTVYLLGFKYKASTSIAGNTTYGYGRLDGNGFWQFPIVKRTRVKAGEKRTFLIRLHDLLEDECMFYLNTYYAEKKTVPFPRNILFKALGKIEMKLRKIVEK